MELSKEEVLQFYAFTREMRVVLEMILDKPSLKPILNSNERKMVKEAHDKLLAYRNSFIKKASK